MGLKARLSAIGDTVAWGSSCLQPFLAQNWLLSNRFGARSLWPIARKPSADLDDLDLQLGAGWGRERHRVARSCADEGLSEG
jgi:hypothetical protein